MISAELPFRGWGLMRMMWRCELAAVAKPVIVKMCANDKGNGNYQKGNLVQGKKLL